MLGPAQGPTVGSRSKSPTPGSACARRRSRAPEPFRQVEQNLSRRFEGSGLGRPLAKQLVELHRGTPTIMSELGKGTTVFVSLPPHRVIPGAA
jgi:signal transduction histidine kinase